MLLYFIAYLAIGEILVLCMGLKTAIEVCMKGYDLNDFNKIVLESVNKDFSIVSFIFGTLFWPIRVFSNRHLGRDLIKAYEQYISESE